jgi:predicted dehydrogenase
VSGAPRSDFVWAVVGPGAIADQFSSSLAAAGAGRVGPVLSRSPERAGAFCARHGGEPVASLDALIERMQREPKQARAVYVATPHALHAAAARPCLEAGLAVLCEKPLTCDPAETHALLELSRRTGTPLAEAYMYRAHPQLARAVELAAELDLGPPTLVTGWFTFDAERDPNHRLFDPALGGGAILDVGGYPVSAALHLGEFAANAIVVVTAGAADFGPTGVDERSRAGLRWDGHERARVSVAIHSERPLAQGLEIAYSNHRIELPTPFLIGNDRNATEARVEVFEAEPRRSVASEVVRATHDCYGLEARAFEQQVAAWRVGPLAPFVTHAESSTLAELLDAWKIQALSAATHATDDDRR